MSRKASLNEILDDRERRAERQRELITLYGTPLVSFTMNIPGAEKDSPMIRAGFAEGLRRLHPVLSVRYEEERYGVTGPETLLCVDMDPGELKRITVKLEEADALGRLFDMDVIRTDGTSVSRTELGLPMRKCLLCGEPAKMCRRAGRHTTDELNAAAKAILRDALPDAEAFEDNISEELADLACAALRAELDATPKPGLVDRYNNGSHEDMNYSTFCRSIEALRPYFLSAARLGAGSAGEGDFVPESEVFEELRKLGKTAEREMFAATGGVNTHKGAIFAMGLAVCAAARVLTACGPGMRFPRTDDRRPVSLTDEIAGECARLTKGLCARDFDSVTPENAETAGKKLYARFGITGARGQAEGGFPAVREAGLPYYRKALSGGAGKNDAACGALLAIMCHTADTNLIKRGGMEKAEQVAARIRSMPDRVPTEKELLLLDCDFIREHLSPGGSADLLALTIFLHELDIRFGTGTCRVL